MSDNLSKYERLIENLKVLENRNPDLKRILTFLDIWLNQFVNSDNAVPSGITCNSSVSCGIEQNSGAVNGTSDGSCVNRGASHGNVSTSDVGRDVGINVAERS
ncbi:MAG: hypothetical protein Q4C70_12855, partial [Planctomycetia bacterium]|nr:hypothetical protein [Planctomycetia bacterium]